MIFQPMYDCAYHEITTCARTSKASRIAYLGIPWFETSSPESFNLTAPCHMLATVFV